MIAGLCSGSHGLTGIAQRPYNVAVRIENADTRHFGADKTLLPARQQESFRGTFPLAALQH